MFKINGINFFPLPPDGNSFSGDIILKYCKYQKQNRPSKPFETNCRDDNAQLFIVYKPAAPDSSAATSCPLERISRHSTILPALRCSISYPVLASASSGDGTRDDSSNLRPRPTGTQVQRPRSPPSVPTCPALARARFLPDGPRLLEVCMKSYLTKDIRNVGIVGHGGTGKTQLVSSLLFAAGMTPRWGKIADGSTTTDWDEEEIARKISIQTGLAYAEWPATPSSPSGSSDRVKINFIDLPGYSTFITEAKASLIAADASGIAGEV